jgi:hypothetical protein
VRWQGLAILGGREEAKGSKAIIAGLIVPQAVHEKI